jgi:serine/threonine protein kinase
MKTQQHSLNSDNILNRVKIGEGNYSVVARGFFNGKPVVRKQMKGTIDSKEYADAFYCEINVLKSLPQHASVVGFLGYEIRNNIGVVFLESCDHALSEYIKNKGVSLPINVIQGLVDQLCEGLQYLYDHEVCHRDIKPANILIKQSSMPLVKFADFGASACLRDKKNSKDLFKLVEECKTLMTPIYKPFELWESRQLEKLFQSDASAEHDVLLFREAYEHYQGKLSCEQDRRRVGTVTFDLWDMDEDSTPAEQVKVMNNAIDMLYKTDIFSLGMTMLVVLSNWKFFKKSFITILCSLEKALGPYVDRASTPMELKSHMGSLFTILQVDTQTFAHTVSSPTTVTQVP